MNPLNQVNIDEQSTTYNIKLSYHSDRECENYDAKILGIAEADGSITLHPKDNDWSDDGFIFNHSDPERVIAIAQMMLSFAQMIKNENETIKAIDSIENV